MAAAAANEVDDFSSSDIEIPEKENPYAHLGKDSIASMFSRRVEDRVKSKVASKQLTQVFGAPMTQRNRALWSNRFEAFCKITLNHKPGTIPTGEDIERHLLVIVDHLRPRGCHKDAHQISYTCISHGLKWIINSLQFRFEDFKLSTRDHMRLKNVLHTLLQEGRITKNPVRAKQWIGATIIFGMAKSLLADAINCGTLSWDVTICRVLSIVLQSALCTRGGDLAVSYGYDELTCMRFEHVKIKLTYRDGVERLEGLFEIAYAKGEKDTQSDNMKKPINALHTPDHNAICVVKLILIHALRIGAVDSQNIHDLLASTRRRVDKTIQWSHSKWPVLPAFQVRGRGIVHDQPANTKNILTNVKLGADKLGIVPDVIGHDLRRGAAADVAALDHNVLKGNMHDGVVSALGHSQSSVDNGVTRKYIGKLQTDTWELRTAEISRHEDPFVIEVAALPFTRIKRMDKKLITQYCEEHDLDATNAADRRAASKKLHEIAKASHFAGQGCVDTPQVDTPDSGKGKNKNHIALLENRSAVNSILTSAREQIDQITSENIDPRLRSHTVCSDAETEEDDENTEGWMSLATSIADLVSGDSVQELADVQNRLFDPTSCDQLTTPSPKVLTLDSVAFIDFFSRINIICSERVPSNRVDGGSKDPWTRFRTKCRNHVFGCVKDFYTIANADTHHVSCRYTSKEAAEEEQQKLAIERPFTCEKCHATFAKRKTWRSHVQKCGKSFVAKVCEEDGCDPAIIFKTQGSWNAHRSDNHGSFTARVCPLNRECGHEVVYTSRESYKSHLIRIHRLAGIELAEHMPRPEVANKGKNFKRKQST